MMYLSQEITNKDQTQMAVSFQDDDLNNTEKV